MPIADVVEVKKGSEPPIRKSSRLPPWPSLLGGLLFAFSIYALLGIGIACIWSDIARGLMVRWWTWLLVFAIAGMILSLLGLKWVDGRGLQFSPAARLGLMTFGLAFCVVLSVSIVLLPETQQRIFAAKCVILALASLLPGALYFLFIRTRRPSIFHEFLSNLNRFGLLDRRTTVGHEGLKRSIESEHSLALESDADLRRRLDGYFQRFEAVYGVLRFEMPQLWRDTLAREIAGAHMPAELNRTDFVTCLLDENCGRQGMPTPEARVGLTDLFTLNVFIPIGFATVLAALGWLLVLQPEIDLSRLLSDKAAATAAAASIGAGAAASQTPELMGPLGKLQMLPDFSPVSFGFLGAYFFGLQLLFRRFVRRDLGPNAIVAFTNRIVLAFVGSWVAIAAYGALVASTPGQLKGTVLETLDGKAWPSGLLVTCFVIGVFPRILWQLIESVLARGLSFVIPNLVSQQPLSQLDGLTVWHESRLEEEDIENIPNMATADVVDLMLHTQFPADRLVDWIDQAILFKALGADSPEADKKEGIKRQRVLRAHGIRTATGLVFAYGAMLEAHGAEGHDLKDELEQLCGPNGLEGISTMVRTLPLEANFDHMYAWRRSGARGRAEAAMAAVPD